MLARPIMFDSAQQRALLPGDVVAGGEIIQPLTTVGAGSLSAALMLSNVLYRTGPTGAYADVFDSAENIINAALSSIYLGSGATAPAGVPMGTTWRLRFVNSVAFANTPTAGLGVTLGNNTAIAASSVKDYLIQVLNGTPKSVGIATTTNASAVITGMAAAQTQLVTPGMLVSGTGIPGGTTVLSVQPGVGITLSANATASGSLIALTFNPVVRIDGIGQMLL